MERNTLVKLINQSIDRWVATGNPEHKDDFNYLLKQIKKARTGMRT